MKTHHRTTIDTTLGELIEAASEVAFEHCQDPTEAYELTGLVLVELLKRRFSPLQDDASTTEGSAGKNYLN
jgi:hypothetical protein